MPRSARRKRKAADRMLSKDAYELLHPDLVMSTAEKEEWKRNQPGTITDELDDAYAMAYNTGLSHEDATQAAQQAVFGGVRSDKVGKQNLQNVQIASAAGRLQPQLWALPQPVHPGCDQARRTARSCASAADAGPGVW